MNGTSNAQERGYIYVEMVIRDRERFKEYTSLSAPAVRAAGGRYIVAGVTPEALEAEGGDRVVIVEFPTVAQARAFYHSTKYQAARQRRLGVADFRMLLLPGAPP